MMTFVITFAVTFVYVFLRATQQINVIQNRYMWVMPASIGMGLCEVTVVLMVVKADTLVMGIVTGIAGGLGCLLAMRFNVGRKKDVN